jgi:hypothetical protein
VVPAGLADRAEVQVALVDPVDLAGQVEVPAVQADLVGPVDRVDRAGLPEGLVDP